MKQLLRLFDNQPIRAVIVRGEPWFIAQDVAEALGFERPRDAYRMLEPDEKGAHPVRTPGGEQDMVTINESGLYAMVLRSNRPEAKRFRKWITSEVLPSIRKYGKYQVDPGLRRSSISTRTTLTAQWQEHGASAPYHYINLTRKEYKVLGYSKDTKKEYMTQEQVAELRVFEALESLKLIKNPFITGFKNLDASLEETGRMLPLFTSGIACARQEAEA